ncbi:uncharacterized protein LOC135930289 [Gordionus sp. m RMFG-2023]|uniref:uncharacterized protein LOC135930289 n=1 Tax=Gordionus sp. m RMFG-2023 TaxID=3053472 RepID=UPI0031FD3107
MYVRTLLLEITDAKLKDKNDTEKQDGGDKCANPDPNEINNGNPIFLNRDMIIVRLLTLVDIPVLEGLLSWENEQRCKITKDQFHQVPEDDIYRQQNDSKCNMLSCSNVDRDDKDLEQSYSINDPYSCKDEWSNCALKLLHKACIYDNFLDVNENNYDNDPNSTIPRENLMTESEIILKMQLFHTISEYYEDTEWRSLY